MTPKAEIKRFFDAYFAAFQSRDPDACSRFYEEDAEYIGCGMAPVRGRKAIANLHREILAGGFSLDYLHTDELIIDGDMAYARQRLGCSSGMSHAMLVPRRGPDGKWLVHAEAEVPS